jgi:hypothetical protein
MKTIILKTLTIILLSFGLFFSFSASKSQIVLKNAKASEHLWKPVVVQCPPNTSPVFGYACAYGTDSICIPVICAGVEN